MAQLSDVIKAKVILLREEGYSQRDIAAGLGISKTGVLKTIARNFLNGNNNALQGCGRPRKTSNATDHMIRRIAVADPTASSTFIQSQLPGHMNISPATIRRRLCNDFGLKSCRPAKKPRLSPKNIADRLDFCKKTT